MQEKTEKKLKYLHICEKSSTFAADLSVNCENGDEAIR